MKRRSCKFVWIWIVVMLMLSAHAGIVEPVLAATNRIVIDGRPLQTDVEPMIVDGRMFVPMRVIFEAHGVVPQWDSDTRSVHAETGASGGELRITIGETEAWLGNRSYQLDAPPFIDRGSTFVPVRFISESLGSDVKWRADIRTALITTAAGADYPESGSGHGAADVDLGFERSKADIRAKWAEYAPAFTGDPFVQEPSVQAPYRTGKLHPDYIRDGVNAANFVRYLAGLPDDLTASDDYNTLAQHGAVLLQAVDVLTHHPDKPSDMEETFYQTGYESTTTANISWFRYSTTGSLDRAIAAFAPDHGGSLVGSVFSYMSDGDDVNVHRVGHRRWILHPPLQQIGFGHSQVESTDGRSAILTRYSTMQVMDMSRTEAVDYEYIAWPSAGYFPTRLFRVNDSYGSDPWSVTVHPNKYKIPADDQIEVRLTDLNRDVTWVLDSRNRELESGQPFFNIDRSRIGIDNVIVFRPDNQVTYADGSRFRVRITGLEDSDGRPAVIEYETHFFEL